MRELTSLVFALFLAVPAAAATINVPGDQPTVNAALAVANAGDTIQLAKGSHAGFAVSGKVDIRIRGTGKSVIDGSGVQAISVGTSNDIVIEKLTINNPSADGDGIWIDDSEDITIQKCTIDDVDGTGVRAFDSDRLIVQKCTIRARGHGVWLDAPPLSDALIAKNRFETNSSGVVLEGDGHVVEKNRFAFQDGFGVDIEDGASNARISKNRFDNPHNAVRVLGSGHIVERNNVKKTSFAGIRVGGSNCVVEKNKIKDTEVHGIIVEGDDNQFLKNKISKTGGSGITLDPDSEDPPHVTGNTLEKNKIRKAEGAGIFIESTVSGNTFTRNNVKKSGGFDLDSEAPEGNNTFDGNKFGTTDLP